VLEKKLGDGYTQRAADGLNSVALKYEAVWTALTVGEAKRLLSFFSSRAAVEPFTVPVLPGLEAKKWVCKEWSVEWASAQRRNVRAMLEEDFSL
jgi:phage-related protein